MKTARERAEAFCFGEVLPIRQEVAELERLFKEYARDQRHLCAETISSEMQEYGVADSIRADTHRVVMSAPFPGEESGR